MTAFTPRQSAWRRLYRPTRVYGKRKKEVEIETHERTCPFGVGQIIINGIRPSIRRLIISEPKLVRISRYGHYKTCWSIEVLNLRKTANGGKKSKLVIPITKISKYQVFSDFDVAEEMA